MTCRSFSAGTFVIVPSLRERTWRVLVGSEGPRKGRRLKHSVSPGRKCRALTSGTRKRLINWPTPFQWLLIFSGTHNLLSTRDRKIPMSGISQGVSQLTNCPDYKYFPIHKKNLIITHVEVHVRIDPSYYWNLPLCDKLITRKMHHRMRVSESAEALAYANFDVRIGFKTVICICIVYVYVFSTPNPSRLK